jgi:hypothetical protein
MATGIIHDLSDGGDTPATLRAAAETAVNFTGRPWRGLVQGRANIDIAQYITGTDNHGARYIGEVGFTPIDIRSVGRPTKEKRRTYMYSNLPSAASGRRLG